MQFITTFVTNFVQKFITKFGDSLNLSPNFSPNLVTNSSQKTLAVLPRDITRVSQNVTQSHAVGAGLTAQTTGTAEAAAALQGAHNTHHCHFPIDELPRKIQSYSVRSKTLRCSHFGMQVAI